MYIYHHNSSEVFLKRGAPVQAPPHWVTWLVPYISKHGYVSAVYGPMYLCGSECVRGSFSYRAALPVCLPRWPRRRYACGLFNKTAITPDMVMYCGARLRDLSPTERLPVGLYGDRIFQCRHVTLPVNQRDASSAARRWHLSNASIVLGRCLN